MLYPIDGNEAEVVEIDFPEYDLRRRMTGRDPLRCLMAFRVMVETVLPNLYGWRMCPNCPHRALSDDPCMDIFGSNVTPMGGSLGRVDAIVSAIEAQKAEGVLHLHFFIYVQMAHQFKTLPELAAELRQGLLSVSDFKNYVSTARRATYPGVAAFNASSSDLERSLIPISRSRRLEEP